MDTILVKIFATALTLSQVTTQPQAVKTNFDPLKDQDEVVQILRNGCAHMKQAFDIESINLDDLIATALDDPKAVGADIKAFHGLNFADLNTAYHQFCKNEPIANPVVDLKQVIDFFNSAAADLPDQNVLKGKKLPSLSVVLDGNGQDFADVFQPGNRRVWVPLASVPDFVQKAFVAAEDRRFFQHHGVDERGIIRAFIGNLADPGRPQGGSTITQQVVKNLLVGEDVTYERKIREMIVASRLEQTLSKNEILELYLNSAYLGRGSWGVEMASRGYFGKPAKDLTLAESAMLAGLLKGPNYYNPDRHPDRAKERLGYVLDRMQEDGVISAAQKDKALAAPPKLIAYQHPRRNAGFHFVDFVDREAKADGIPDLTADSYTVHSTINAQLQRDTEAALQEGLARYELSMGRMQFRGPEANIADAVRKLEVDNRAGIPAWQQALQAVRLPLYDVHWTPAVVVLKGGGKKGDDTIRVGLPDGRILPLTVWTAAIRRGLSLYDVVYVHVVESRAGPTAKIKSGNGSRSLQNGTQTVVQTVAQAQLRVRPTVQGAALVLENKTGRILAMAGSFSYPLSQLNRAAQTQRQPGSAMKPLTYLTALQRGLQPNTLVLNEPITLPPISNDVDGRYAISRDYGGYARPEDFWSPRNADYNEGGVYTMRRGLEHSVNVVTAHLLDGGISESPEKSLDEVCATAIAAKIYSQCVRYYPFVLGAQPVRMIDLAAFYAAVANEGALPRPHGIDSIEENGRTIYQYPKTPPPRIDAADRVSFYQLKTMLQGVVARGTARSIAWLSPYVAGKTGTTENAVDGWFIGFTNDVTVAVWVGYDNGDGKRRSLGSNETGARVALPIFQPIIEAVWGDQIAPKAPLSGPSPEARQLVVDVPIDYMTGDRVGGGNFIEHFRRTADGQADDTQYQLVSREDAYYQDQQWGNSDQGSFWSGGGYNGNGQWIGRSYYPNQNWPNQNWSNQNWRQPPQPPPSQPTARGLFQPWHWSDNPPLRNFFRGGGVN
ncbi:MAG TPA: transglycosylase domain-containing protein [Xanthobacteraceae bacterium]|nr:transglycosylase domain-containing protein [Xanthobacteraceae bacterium]